jgi:hypothetical protein
VRPRSAARHLGTKPIPVRGRISDAHHPLLSPPPVHVPIEKHIKRSEIPIHKTNPNQQLKLTTIILTILASHISHGRRFAKYACASARERHRSRRTAVVATANSIMDMRSSSSDVNTSRVTMVGSTRRMAVYCRRVAAGMVCVVSVLHMVVRRQDVDGDGDRGVRAHIAAAPAECPMSTILWPSICGDWTKAASAADHSNAATIDWTIAICV